MIEHLDCLSAPAQPTPEGVTEDTDNPDGVNGEQVVDYTSTMLMFVALGLVGFVFSLLLKVTDARRKTGISIEKVLLK